MTITYIKVKTIEDGGSSHLHFTFKLFILTFLVLNFFLSVEIDEGIHLEYFCQNSMTIGHEPFSEVLDISL